MSASTVLDDIAFDNAAKVALPARFAHLAVHDTLPKLVRHNAHRHGNETAQREKQLGIWRSINWRELEEQVRLWAIGLHGLGIAAGDAVAIISDSRPDWIASAIAAHAVRARSLGLYQDALDTEIAYLLKQSGAPLVVAENEEQVDKILRVCDQIPSIRFIVYNDLRGMRKYSDPRLISRDSLLERARHDQAANAHLWDQLVDATQGSDIAVLCSTSGTTSNPKLVCLASAPFINHVAHYCELMKIGPEDEYLSLLPMSWIGEQFMALYQPVVARHKLNFAEAAATVMADLREIAPTFMLLAPRAWEQIAANVRAQMMDASKFKQRLFDWSVKTAVAAVERDQHSSVAQWGVMRALRDRLGFSRLRFATTGGAAMGPDTFKFFMAMGVPMLQIYGQTELVGIYCTQRPGDRDFDGVGGGLNAEYELRIHEPDQHGVGEIAARHPYMFKGYYENDGLGSGGLHDGWMHTGDAGFFKPNGQLVVIDRLKDLAATHAGERFSPQFIENKLKFSPYISEAVILGDRRDYPAAIVCIRFAIVSKWAEQRRMSFTTYSDLAGRAEIYALVAEEIGRVNISLPPEQQLRKFVLLYKELDADDGELTRTRKVRRSVIAEKYATIIDAIYSDASEVNVDTEIAFQDGTRQRIRTTLPVRVLNRS